MVISISIACYIGFYYGHLVDAVKQVGSYDKFIDRVNDDVKEYFGFNHPFVKADISCELHINYGHYLLTSAKVFIKEKYEKIIQDVLMISCHQLEI